MEETKFSVAGALSEAQTVQLHALYQGEWWSAGRTLEEVRTMLLHSQFLFAVPCPASGELLAFARVITDHVFKAFVFDVIVHPGHRSAGLGSLLVEHITGHPVLSRVRHIELYCLPERAAFYRRHGFTAEPGELCFLRRIKA